MQTDAVAPLDEARSQELEAFLADRIYEFNSQATGHFDGKLLGASIRNEAGEVVAGLRATLGELVARSRTSRSAHTNEVKVCEEQSFEQPKLRPFVAFARRWFPPRAAFKPQGSTSGLATREARHRRSTSSPFQHRLRQVAWGRERRLALRSSVSPSWPVEALRFMFPLRRATPTAAAQLKR